MADSLLANAFPARQFLSAAYPGIVVGAVQGKVVELAEWFLAGPTWPCCTHSQLSALEEVETLQMV